MRDAFKIKNGWDRFIAIKKDSLVGLDEKSKEKVLEGFKDLSQNLYWFFSCRNFPIWLAKSINN